MKIKMKSMLLALGLVLVITVGPASAFTIPPGAPGVAGAQLEDDDRDYHLSAAGTAKSGIIIVGDLLLAPLEMTKIIDILPPISPTQNLILTPEELTAIALISVIPSLPTDPAGRIRFGPPTPAQWLLTTGLVVPVGTMAAFFIGTGATNDLDVATCTTQTDCVDKAKNGAPWMVWGFSTDLDNEWFFDPVIPGADASNIVAGIPAATKVGVANFALTALDKAGLNISDQLIPGCGVLFQCLGDGRTDILGSADILGGLGLPSGFARSDADALVNVTAVPEPATLLLLGLGLLGLGAVGARRRR